MADGPLDFSKGYLFESNKGISDRRAAAGLPPGPGDAARASGSTNGRHVEGGSGSLMASLLLGFGWLMWKAAEFILPILLRLMLEAAKLAGQMLCVMLSGGKRR